ncbi:carboxymuconolactone decarboxylase family protein [Saccharopolyspora sp. ID03-671]|uniref:carboxymuconolactone decarboxylase family protein n=1 Tax=Saccharopolyspora sp. ID03-671 TaxID=3073066 RepID=UPI003249BC57
MSDDGYERGLKVMDEVYGAGFSKSLDGQTGAFLDETVGHLFGEIWNRPGLSTRDRRLLVLGATAALGRADLVQVQARGALLSEDCSEEELYESALQLAFYVGWGNATSVQQGIAQAVAQIAAESKQD